jgi:hypothetical protein
MKKGRHESTAETMMVPGVLKVTTFRQIPSYKTTINDHYKSYKKD